MKSLLYPGASIPVYVELQAWFGTSDHIDIGYASDDPAQVKSQTDDMIRRAGQSLHATKRQDRSWAALSRQSAPRPSR